VLAKATTEVDLSGIPEGGVHTIRLAGQAGIYFASHPGRDQGDAGFRRRI